MHLFPLSIGVIKPKSWSTLCFQAISLNLSDNSLISLLSIGKYISAGKKGFLRPRRVLIIRYIFSHTRSVISWLEKRFSKNGRSSGSVSYTHLRAHETPEHLVCRLLLEKKKKEQTYQTITHQTGQKTIEKTKNRNKY